MNPPRFSSLVVGGGPCGILAVGICLDHIKRLRYLPNMKPKKVAWVNSGKFTDIGGRFNRYDKVPGNTPVHVIESAFGMIDSLNYTAKLSVSDPQKTCELSVMIDALKKLSAHLIEDNPKHLQPFPTTFVSSLDFNTISKTFTAETNNGESVRADNVILVTGGVPNPSHIHPHLHTICPTNACIPNHPELQACASKNVTIVGNSHTGMLIAQNLLESTIINPRKVNVLYLEKTIHAETRDGGLWTKNDGTGLKGTVSQWVKDSIDTGAFGPKFSYVKNLGTSLAETNKLIDALETDVVIYSTGFVNNLTLPILKRDGKELNEQETIYKAYDGFSGEILPQLFGGGIGFPEKWQDPEGKSEHRVGFNIPYVKHMKRIVKRQRQFEE